MFQKFKDKVNSALGGGDEAKVQTLTNMGFDATQARNALHNTGGNVDRAAELLLAATNNPAPPPPSTGDDDDDLQRAIKASMEDQGRRHHHRSAANTKAAEAAAKRHANANKKFGTATKPKAKTTTTRPQAQQQYHHHAGPRRGSGGLTTHHPGVKVPAKLQDKTKEEQVLRCTDRLKSHPSAVDTLLKALTMIRDNPNNDKYRKIDKSSAGFQRTLQNAPGAEGLLLAMNFHTRGAYELVLERPLVDHALLYLGISALEGVKESPEYKDGKRKIVFIKHVKAIDLTPEEDQRRKSFLSKVPTEPMNGALMQVVIGEDKITRRFDGDDVLQDVLHWIAGMKGSIFLTNLENREWCLVDQNRYPAAPIDCKNQRDKTLQYLGLWPSGRLEILPSTDEWRINGQSENLMGSARGLGAAPKEVLN